MEVVVKDSGGVDSIGLDDFERLGQEGGNGAGHSCREEAEGWLVFDRYCFGHT